MAASDNTLALAGSMQLTESNLDMVYWMGGTINDLSMTLIVNGVEMLPYIVEKGIEVTLRGVDGEEAGRTMDAVMWRDLRAYKLDISVTCKDLPIHDAVRVCTAIMPEYVTVTIVTPFTGRLVTEFYSNNIPSV